MSTPGDRVLGAVIGAGIEAGAQLATSGRITDSNAIMREGAIGLAAGATGVGTARLAASGARLAGLVRTPRVVGGVERASRGEGVVRAVAAGAGSGASADGLRRGQVDGQTAVAAAGGAVLGGGAQATRQLVQAGGARASAAIGTQRMDAAAARGHVGARLEQVGSMTSHPGSVPPGTTVGVVAGAAVNRAPDVRDAMERQK
jgi:hypothetical protein